MSQPLDRLCHSSQLSDRQCYSSQTEQWYSSMLQLSFILKIKGKYILEAWGHADPKDVKRRERAPALWLLFSYVFSPAPGPPCVNWASQERCLFSLRPSLQFLDLPLFSFRKLFPSLSSSHHHSELLFPNYLTKPTEYYHVPPEIYITY